MVRTSAPLSIAGVLVLGYESRTPTRRIRIGIERERMRVDPLRRLVERQVRLVQEHRNRRIEPDSLVSPAPRAARPCA